MSETDNVMRHEYRRLSADEEQYVRDVKDAGLAFYRVIEKLESRVGHPTRETSLAKTKIEEAVMWATKHIT